ncbi:hypothetical protein OROMI_006397 [Orobanche minor]
MTVDRCSWRCQIRVVDSFFGSGSVVESLRVGLSRLALGYARRVNYSAVRAECIEYVIVRFPLETVHKGKKKGSVIKNFALKSVDKSHESTVAREEYKARILQNLDHSNVVKFYEGYCGGGDLRTLLEQEGKLAEDEVRDLARDPVEGLRYIHSKGIIHCDLKPSNILLDGNGTTKLCDFGLSREVSETCFSLVPQAANKKRRGTPSYMAPELFDDGGVDSYASDLWALGCVLYECYAGRPPFIGNELTQLVNSILYDPTPSLPGNPSPSFANLVSRLLIKDPTDRIEWSEICTHTFWKTPQLLISQFVLPPQPAFDNMMQQQLSYYKPEGNLENKTPVILRRLSRIAKSNLHGC